MEWLVSRWQEAIAVLAALGALRLPPIWSRLGNSLHTIFDWKNERIYREDAEAEARAMRIALTRCQARNKMLEDICSADSATGLPAEIPRRSPNGSNGSQPIPTS